MDSPVWPGRYVLAANGETAGHPRTPCHRRACPAGAGRPNSVPIYVLVRIPPPLAAGYRSRDEQHRYRLA
jgi:hypothetical protein